VVDGGIYFVRFGGASVGLNCAEGRFGSSVEVRFSCRGAHRRISRQPAQLSATSASSTFYPQPSVRVPFAVTRALAFLVLLGAAAPTAPLAQQTENGRATSVWGTDGALQPLVPVPGALLDAPVSRTEYQLGPGDVLDLAMFGEVNQLSRIAVTPEGTLVIPTVGVVGVLGLNLDQAQTRVREQVLRYYRNVGIHLTLSQIRQFKVFVVGDVPQPGVHIASAATRVSEVIPEDSARRVLPRNVLLRRATGESVQVDLIRFRQLGDLTANPTLREGDALVVPAVDETVQVFGHVAFPGMYEHRRGETLAELLIIANGGRGFPASAADSVRLSRAVSRDQQQIHVLSQAEALGASGAGFIVQPFDAVYVAGIANFREHHAATVTGQVAFPGTYPIRPDTTTVRDLVGIAGGFTQEASLTGAALRRQRQPASERLLRQLNSVPPELLSSAERRILQAGSQGDETNVVIDFQRLFAGGQDAYNQVLRAGDTLSVPRHRDEIVILGAVLQPGIVQHISGYRAVDFVVLAGGFARNADRDETVVVKASTGNRVSAFEVRAIEPGDMIIVPYRERRDYLRTLQTTSTVVTTVTGLVLTFLAFVR
jgi:polysaccharide biosynthesis/export protein